ncbi:MAG: M28 family peptidase [Longimicrobiales bacterium]
MKERSSFTNVRMVALGAALLLAGCAQSAATVTSASAGARGEANAVTQADVERIETILAHDSMEGRRVGTVGAAKASAFIAAEMQRIGLEPAGDNGTYFQSVAGTVQNNFASSSSVIVDGKALRWNVDVTAAPGAVGPKPVNAVQVIFGGVTGDSVNTITAEQANGKLVVLLPRASPAVGRGAGPSPKFAGAAAIATINLDSLDARSIQLISNPLQATSPRTTPPRAGAPPVAPQPAPAPPAPQAQLRLTRAGATQLFGGMPVADLKAGATGGTVTAQLKHAITPQPTWTRNVIGIIRGSDPKLKAEWVLIDAHYDHLGKQVPAVNGDSVFNGADDDASGVVAVLEIARAIKAGKQPKRSMIFGAMTGEEGGLIGTNYYIAHPFVPMSSLVANMEIEMIGRADSLSEGRGGAWLTGYERSTMGDMLKANGIRIFPDKRPSQNFFSRSDNRAFACMGIPAHTLSTFNLHKDYHRLSDETQFVDFVHMTEVIRSGARAARILADGAVPTWVPGGSPVGTTVCPGTRAPGS